MQQFAQPSTSSKQDILRAESAANVAASQFKAANKENVSPNGYTQDLFVKQCQINEIALSEIDILKAEQRHILYETTSLGR